MIDLSTSLPGLEMKNPVTPASGTCGYGKELKDFYDLNILGGFVSKSATGERRFGNPLPRIAEGYSGTLNCIGLQNPGVETIAAKELVELRSFYQGPLLCSIAGSSVEEYLTCVNRLNEVEKIDAYEINISCPNVSKGGMSLSSDPHSAYEITKTLKAVSKHPIYMKLTPMVNDVVSIARACKEGGADGLVLANSYQGMRIDLKTGKPILSRKIGGYGGPAILPMALKVVYQVASEVDIPIIGVGGIACANDVLEYLYAGASAVQVGSMNLKDPLICKKIIEELPSVFEFYGRKSVKACIKEAHK